MGVGVGVFGILVVVVWGEPDADFGGADGACDLLAASAKSFVISWISEISRGLGGWLA